MSDWGWVALAFAAVYGTLLSYVAWTAIRTRNAARRLRELT
jgi:hypothetical protein